MGTWSYVYDGYGELTQQTRQQGPGRQYFLRHAGQGRPAKRGRPQFELGVRTTPLTASASFTSPVSRSDAGTGCSTLASGDYLRTELYDNLGRPRGTTLKIDGTNYPYTQTSPPDDRVDTLNYPRASPRNSSTSRPMATSAA